MTTPYSVKIAPRVIDQVKQLNSKNKRTIVLLIEALAVNPRPPGAKKVEGMTGLYAESIDAFRLLYKIDEQEILFLSLQISSLTDL